jgi:esterase
MDPVLSHTSISASGTEPREWIYFLHGIYGSGRNWGNVARSLVEVRPDWGVVLVDLRLHGGSVGFEPPHSLEACAADLSRLEHHLERPAAVVVGHSFGGKVALVHLRGDREAPRQVWVVDSTLRVGEPYGAPWSLIGLVRSLPDRFHSRDQFVEAIAAHGHPSALGQWLAMNLVRTEDGFRWKLDWDGVEEMLRDYFATDVWPVLREPPAGLEIHVVRAAESGAIDAATQAELASAGRESGRLYLHTVPGGHWINTENPDAILELLTDRLPNVPLS